MCACLVAASLSPTPFPPPCEIRSLQERAKITARVRERTEWPVISLFCPSISCLWNRSAWIFLQHWQDQKSGKVELCSLLLWNNCHICVCVIIQAHMPVKLSISNIIHAGRGWVNVPDAPMSWWAHGDGWSRAACQLFGWLHRESASAQWLLLYHQIPISNMSHWKKARALTLRFRPIFHLLAITLFLSCPLPLQTSS